MKAKFEQTRVTFVNFKKIVSNEWICICYLFRKVTIVTLYIYIAKWGKNGIKILMPQDNICKFEKILFFRNQYLSFKYFQDCLSVHDLGNLYCPFISVLLYLGYDPIQQHDSQPISPPSLHP